MSTATDIGVVMNELEATAMTSIETHEGDWIEVDAVGGGPSRRGQIVEVLGPPGHQHYRVRWDEDHETLHFPAQGTRVRKQHEIAQAGGGSAER